MIKRYYKIIERYFSFGANNKKLAINLFVTALLRNLTFILLPIAASKVVDYANTNYVNAFVWSITFLVFALIYVISHHFNYVAYEKYCIYTHNKLQDLIYDKVTSYDNDFSKNMSSSFIVNTAFNDVGEVMQIPDRLFDSINGIISILITAIILFKVNIYIGLLTIFFNISALILYEKNSKKRNYYLNKERIVEDNISELMGQVLDGNKEVKTFDMSEEIDKYLDSYVKKHNKIYLNKTTFENNISVFIPGFLGIGKILLYLALIYLILENKFSVATLVLVISYYENIESKFTETFEDIDAISESSVRVNRIYSLLNYKNRNMIEFGNDETDDIKGKIEFKNVSFIYEKQVITKNMNFTIMPNSFTTIVGKSGCGKSTIFRLLLRLYKINSGQILIDDKDIYSYSKEVHSKNVSIVTQKPFIFDMSIRENLNLVDKNINNQIEVCKKVGIHDYIINLKNGYNTKLSVDANELSEGQKQLLSLARTLLSKSEILLFDEVTSSLDVETSEKIVNVLKELKKDHTIIMITHKPDLMKASDDIIVINNGKIVGRGKHKDLINNKYYNNLQK